MHKSTKILSTIASLLFLISILLGIIFTCSFNHSFYQYEYNKSNQAEVIGMSDKDLTKATDTLLDYLENKRDDIVVTKKEVAETIDINKDDKVENTSIFNINEDSETYGTLLVYIVRENETINSIITKYNTTIEELEKYNDLKDLSIGTKLIIPLVNE